MARPTARAGLLPLDDDVVHPNPRVQGVMMVHKGKVVYEAHPGMDPMDRHVWMSPGKATVGLILAMLEEEGKLDFSKPVVAYVPRLSGAPQQSRGRTKTAPGGMLRRPLGIRGIAPRISCGSSFRSGRRSGRRGR